MPQRIIHRALRFTSRLQNEDGQALVEYVLILSLVSVAGIAGLELIGGNVVHLLNQATNVLTSAVP
jgi:Flp pilus assembly pilin Flp